MGLERKATAKEEGEKKKVKDVGNLHLAQAERTQPISSIPSCYYARGILSKRETGSGDD